MKEAKEFIEKNIIDNEPVILALSGGPDSMCLINLLLSLNKNVIALHINHNTRQSCDGEYIFLKKYAKEKNFTLEYFKIENYTKNRFTEEEARSIRYKHLKEIAAKYNAKKVLTAHHADDLTETILMRLLRGSTIGGYAGIKRKSTWDEIDILRPLLLITKDEIYAYLKSKNIPYVEDETNALDITLRNRIRHHILPLLKEYEPNYAKKVFNMSTTLTNSETFIKLELDKIKKDIINNKQINISKFTKLEDVEQEFLLESYLHDIYKDDLKKVSHKHQEILKKLLLSNRSSLEYNFPGDYKFFKTNSVAYITKETMQKQEKILVTEYNVLANNHILKKVDNYTEKSNNEIHLNSKELSLPLYIVKREVGMRMQVKNLLGTKKVNDILIDSKIPKEQKDLVPIMVDSKGNVLWILGLKKSKYDIEKNGNYDIIYKYTKEEE